MTDYIKYNIKKKLLFGLDWKKNEYTSLYKTFNIII